VPPKPEIVQDHKVGPGSELETSAQSAFRGLERLERRVGDCALVDTMGIGKSIAFAEPQV